MQISRNVTDAGAGFLRGKQHLILKPGGELDVIHAPQCEARFQRLFPIIPLVPNLFWRSSARQRTVVALGWGALWSLPKRFDSLMPKAKLRQDTIRSLRYVGAAQGKSQCIYWDLALPGFGLRKFPNGRGSYVCTYRVQQRKRPPPVTPIFRPKIGKGSWTVMAERSCK